MREFTVPTEVQVTGETNLADSVFTHAEHHPRRVALRERVEGAWADVTSAEFAKRVSALAKGFAAQGLQPGDRIAIMAGNCFGWTWADYAAWAAGLVPVPIYETSSLEQVDWILSDSGAAAAVAQRNAHAELLRSAPTSPMPDHRVFVINDGDLERVAESGAQVGDEELATRRRSVNADSVATIIYTSGTTGRPKGCVLTHSNFLFTARSAKEALPEVLVPGTSTLLFIPLAHVFARFVQVACIDTGIVIGHTGDVKNLLGDLADFTPDFLLAVPRVFEKVHAGIKTRATAEGGVKAALFNRAEAIAIAHSTAQQRGSIGLALQAEHALYDKLVYSKIRTALGGRVKYAVSGGAPLGARLGHFFRGVGVTILEGYGLTETTAPATVNTPAHIRIGSVGRALPGTVTRIADDGEILLRGGNVFREYRHNETATAEVIDAERWFHSGDLGQIDDDGFLSITGRKKEIIVTAGGKNVAPAVLEDRVRANPLVSQCLVVGDQKPFVAALVTLDAEAVPGWLKLKSKSTAAEDLPADPDVITEVQSAIDDANKAVSHAEAIKKFRILTGDFTEEGGEMTPSMKLKRSVIGKKYAEEIERLYS